MDLGAALAAPAAAGAGRTAARPQAGDPGAETFDAVLTNLQGLATLQGAASGTAQRGASDAAAHAAAAPAAGPAKEDGHDGGTAEPDTAPAMHRLLRPLL